jgi:parallel beta-helix repeat protein
MAHDSKGIVRLRGFWHASAPAWARLWGVAAVLLCLLTGRVGRAAEFVVTPDAEGNGAVSLSEAIQAINLIGPNESHRITFSAPMSIRRVGGMPTIRVPVEIDGTSVPGYVDTPLVTFDFVPPTFATGLNFATSSLGQTSEVAGLAFVGFPSAVRLGVETSDITIRDCVFEDVNQGVDVIDNQLRGFPRQNITIESNTFRGHDVQVAVDLKYAQNVGIRANRFVGVEGGIRTFLSDAIDIESNEFVAEADFLAQRFVFLDNCSNVTVGGNAMGDCRIPIFVASGSQITIDDNDLTVPAAAPDLPRVGIFLTHSSFEPDNVLEIEDLHITNNRILGEVSGDEITIGIDQTGSTIGDNSNFEISGNTLQGHGTAIRFANLRWDDATDVLGRISNNVISDNSVGISTTRMSGPSAPGTLSILNNQLVGNGVALQFTSSSITGAPALLIGDNTISGNDVGVSLTDSSASIDNNDLSDNGFGIQIGGTITTQHQITNNVLAGNNEAGIDVGTTSFLTVTGNQFFENVDGMRIHDVQGGGPTIRDNDFGESSGTRGNEVGIRIFERALIFDIGGEAGGSNFAGNDFAILVETPAGNDIVVTDLTVRNNTFGVAGVTPSDAVVLGGGFGRTSSLVVEGNTMLPSFDVLDFSGTAGNAFVRENTFEGGEILFSGGFVLGISSNTMEGEVPITLTNGARSCRIADNTLTGPVSVLNGAREVELSNNVITGTGEKLVDLGLGSNNPGNTGIASPTAVTAARGATDTVQGSIDGPGRIDVFGSNATGTSAVAFLGSVQANSAGHWVVSGLDLSRTDFVIANRSSVTGSPGAALSTSEFSAVAEVQGAAQFAGFEVSPDGGVPWTSQQANLTLNPDVKTEGLTSLQVNGSGWMSLKSPRFRTVVFDSVGTELAFDLFVPSAQANPFWVGSAQVWVTVPGPGIHSAYLGQVDLTPLPRGTWSTLRFTVPRNVREVLLGDFADAQIEIALNNQSALAPFLLDNLRFMGTLTQRTIFHRLGSSTYRVVTTPLTSFDTVSDWSSTVPLTTEFTLRTQGTAALGVAANGYAVVTSRTFSTTALREVSRELNLDVYIPKPQPNPFWGGAVQLFVTCGPLNNAFIGQADLTNMFASEFNSFVFPLSTSVFDVLRGERGTFDGCSFNLVLNVNADTGTYVLDNLGFIRR